MNKEINWEQFELIINECIELAHSKNKDYGTYSLIEFGRKGCLIRMNDKLNRLKTLILNENKPKVETEKIEDTIKDLINYSIYLLLMDKKN